MSESRLRLPNDLVIPVREERRIKVDEVDALGRKLCEAMQVVVTEDYAGL